jgi:hypothetical protein
MRKSAITLAAMGLLSAVTAVSPASAEAHGWDHGWRGQGWHEQHNAGPAIAFGIIGGILAGAAIASAAGHAPPAYAYPPPVAYYGAPYAGYGYYR